MNKTMKTWMLAAILICGVSLVGCGNQNAKKQLESEEATGQVETVQEEAKVPDAVACNVAIEDYLVDVIGKNYAEAASNKDDVLVWGDFWVFNYDLSGDTLKTVSGGDHPGLMHLKKTDKGFEVTDFEQVEDGAGNMESAKRIFGDKYDAFHEINSSEELREEKRLGYILDYVNRLHLSATMVQDYGWPAVELPK